jgi:GAF domain-containing protein
VTWEVDLPGAAAGSMPVERGDTMSGLYGAPALPTIPTDPLTQTVTSAVHVYTDAASHAETDRAVLQTLRRCGVSGDPAVRALVVVDQLLEALRRADVISRVKISVIADPNTVRVEFVFAHQVGVAFPMRRSLSRQVSGLIDANSRRWAIVREGRRTSLWAEIDRRRRTRAARRTSSALSTRPGTAFDVDDIEPIAVLLELSERLSVARDALEVHRVVKQLMHVHLGATFTGIALRSGATMRFLAHDPVPAEASARWGALPVTANNPVAAACRENTPYLHNDPAAAEAEFPGLRAEMQAAGTQSAASLPLVVGGRTVGTLVVTWTRPRRLTALGPFLRIVAGHVAQATYRVSSTVRPVAPPVSEPVERVVAPAASHQEVGPVRLDLVSRLAHVRWRQEPIRLTGREFELLLYLMRHPGVAHDRHALLREVWGIEFAAGTSVVDVTVSRLRRKLGIDDIVTVKDRGYLFRV